MAEASDPEAFEPPGTKRRYDWKTWEAEPFKVWTLYRGVDFDIDPYTMIQSIRIRAQRNKDKAGKPGAVSVQDHLDGSLSLCFYHVGDPRPIIRQGARMEGSPAMTADAADAFGATHIVCDQCGNSQPRVEHLLHITTCLTNTPGIGLTADHFDNRVVNLMSTYTKEGGFDD